MPRNVSRGHAACCHRRGRGLDAPQPATTRTAAASALGPTQPPTLATFGISSPSPPLPALRSVLAKLAPLAASCTLALASSSGGGRASALLPLIVATLPGTEAGKRTKSHRRRSLAEAQIAINSRHGGRRKGGMTGDWCFRPAETYCIGGSHTPKAERVGRHICSVLGTHCHLTDGVWADNASAMGSLIQ